jgi:hypothetical protein
MLKKILVLLGLALSVSANAAIVSIDDAKFGAGAVTRDTGTGLDWLDLTQTSGLSQAYVAGQLGAAGNYAGWRFATKPETGGLLTALGIPVTDLVLYGTVTGRGYQSSYYPLVEAAGGLIGLTFPESHSVFGFEGIIGEASGSGKYEKYAVRLFSDWAVVIRTDTGYVVSGDDPSGYAGLFLVRPSEVPIPAAAWLFGSALLGLGALKRKGEKDE